MELTVCATRPIRLKLGTLELFERLRAGHHPWLLDSALASERSRFTFAGAEPYAVARTRAAETEVRCLRAVRPGWRVGRRSHEGDPLDFVRTLMPPRPPASPAVPFVGGAVGYLGYELAAQLDAHRQTGLDEMGTPDLYLLFVDRLVVFDAQADEWIACALGFAETEVDAHAAAERAAEELRDRVERPALPVAHRGHARRPGSPLVGFEASSYAKCVDSILQSIAAGDVYQACLTHRTDRDCPTDPWDLYRALRRANPAPFASYLELPEVAIVGSSPERFVSVDVDGRVESRPIKGTRPRGVDAAEDRRLRDDLAGSAKDRAENLMIVDLVRNDLGRVCETGSVDVPELMAIESYASVHQMVSTVTGRLCGDRDMFDLVRASFPPGSMTGAPKIAAMRILDELEPVRRGIYSGAIGYFDTRGAADLSVVIRTILLQNGRAYVHSGGGIVADSHPADEWRETLDKTRHLAVALDDSALIRD